MAAIWMTSKEVAARLGITVKTLYLWRREGVGPPWRRVGRNSRSVRYPVSKFEEWCK